MAKARKLLEGAKSLLDDAAEKVGTSTMRRTRRQTKRRANVVQRDAKTGRVRAVSRGERVKRGKDIGKTVGATTGVVGAGAAAATGAKSLDPSSKADKKESKSSTAKTRSQTAGKKSTIKKERIGSGRSMYMLDGRLNISKENLKDSGMTLTEYANYMQNNKKRPPKAQKKMASKGGAKGGKRMPPGMKKGGSASKFPDMTGDGKVTQKDILKARGVPGFSKGDVVVNMVRELSKLGRRDFEKEYGKAALNKAIKDTNKASGLTPTKAKKTPTQKKLAEADHRAELTKFTRQTPAAKKQSQVQVNEKRMERMKNGGMMKSKMSSKGGAKGGRMPGGMKNGGMAKKGPKGYAKGGAMTKKGMAKGGTNKKRAVSRKPRGVGAALRGYGKAMR